MQKAEIKNALDSVTFLDDFAHAIAGQLPFNPNTSHRLVRVEPVDTQWLTTRKEIKSNHIAELVFERIRILTKARFSDQLMEYLADPNTHCPADILFEQAAHYSIRKGLTLTMARLPSGTTLNVSIPGIPVEKNEKNRYYYLSIQEKSGSRNVHPDFQGEEYEGIQTVRSIDAPQNADADTVKKFEQLPQYVCRLDINKIGCV